MNYLFNPKFGANVYLNDRKILIKLTLQNDMPETFRKFSKCEFFKIPHEWLHWTTKYLQSNWTLKVTYSSYDEKYLRILIFENFYDLLMGPICQKRLKIENFAIRIEIPRQSLK